MAQSPLWEDLLNGFSKLSREERFQRLVKLGVLTSEDIRFLSSGGIRDITLAENFIENVIGYFQIPLGIVTNFRMDDKDYIVPMAVEETSIIAAASKTAKWIRQKGFIKTSLIGTTVIGQIQIRHVKNFNQSAEIIEKNRHYLMDLANHNAIPSLVQRGGGVTDIKVRKIGHESPMMVLHVLINTCDAMGANIVNQVCEFLKEPVEKLTSEKVTMCILSNWVDTKLTRAQVVLKNIDPQIGEAISEASYFAQEDPYRAATNNKGVLNGMDPILIATGNDWRAVEAGVHAHAARSGQYRSITTWKMKNSDLIGEFEAPVIVGTVGGVTRLHPGAKMALDMLKVQSSEELSRIIAAMGLVQNLGALRALTGVGIIEGHMKLHIRNLIMGAGANESEIPFLQKQLEEVLRLSKRISLTNAIEILKELRRGKKAVIETGN